MIATAFLSSYISNEDNLKVGDKAPEIRFTNNLSECLEEKNLKLINFWNPKKPSSRIANKTYAEYFRQNNDCDIQFISICTDSDDLLAKELLNYDGIDDCGLHFSYSDVDSRIFKDYNVADNPVAFLISSEGMILDVAPDIANL